MPQSRPLRVVRQVKHGFPHATHGARHLWLSLLHSWTLSCAQSLQRQFCRRGLLFRGLPIGVLHSMSTAGKRLCRSADADWRSLNQKTPPTRRPRRSPLSTDTLAQPPDIDPAFAPETFRDSSLDAVAFGAPGQSAPGRRLSFLDQLGTSVTNPESLKNREWMRDFEWYYHRDMAPQLETLRSRLDSEWAYTRARALGLDPSARLLICGRRFRGVKCGCRTLVVSVGCDAKWCARCMAKKFKRLRRKLKRAMDMHERGRNRSRAEKWRWVLLTLTVAHSGSLEEDRAVIILAWKRLRQWLWKRFGEMSFPFALVWECTDRCDQRGHLHAHVAALWPWVDWADVHEEWLRATCGRSNHIDIQAAKKGANGCAKYLGKYATKGVVLYELGAEVASSFVRATYNKRVITTSEKFWRSVMAECTCCGQPWEETDKPESMVGLIPGAFLEAVFRRDGVQLVPVDRQKPLLVDSG